MKKIIAVCLFLIPCVSVGQNALESAMESVFESQMTTTLPPGYYESVSRGVVSLGSMKMRTPVVGANILWVEPPSFSAGCGGFDIFAGSVSFISKEEFIGLLRAIASNALGYLFELAISEMCPGCMNAISRAAEKINSLNQQFQDSCQMAKGITDWGRGVLTDKQEFGAGLQNGIDGYETAWDSLFAPDQAPSATATLDEANPTNQSPCTTKGNVVWCAMERSSIIDRLIYPTAAEVELKEILMSMTGYISIDNASTASPSRPNSVVPGNKITLEEIAFGGEAIEIYKCTPPLTEEGCVSTTPQTIKLAGYAEIITKTVDDVIDQIRQDQQPTAAQLQVLAMLPYGIATFIHELARSDADGGGYAKSLTGEYADFFAIRMAYYLIEQGVAELKHAVLELDHEVSTPMIRQMDSVLTSYRKEASILASKQDASLFDVLDKYNMGMKQLDKAGNIVLDVKVR